MAVDRVVTTVGTGLGGRFGRDWDLDPVSQRGIVATVAVQALEAVQMAGQFPVDEAEYVTKVNGKTGHDREWRVQLRGPLSKAISYIRFDESVDWVKAGKALLEMIARRSPFARKKTWDRESGVKYRQRHFAESFALLREGRVVVAPGRGFLAKALGYLNREGGAMLPGEVLALVNIQPYARRIEEGWSMQAPSGVLEHAARSRTLKTDLLFKKFEYRPMPAALASEVESQGEVVTYAERRRDRRRGWSYSGRIVRKSRIYPILWWGPPSGSGEAAVARTNREWAGRADIYGSVAQVPGLRGRVARGPRTARERMRRAPVEIRRTFQE